MIENFNKRDTENEKNQFEKINLDKATNMEAAIFFCYHIDHPCEAEVEPGRYENIREFYLREAGELLKKLTNPFAKDMLRKKIDEYKKQ